MASQPAPDSRLDLRTERLGPLPLVITSWTAWACSSCSSSTWLPPIAEPRSPTPKPWACCCARSSSSDEPIYRQQETAASFAVNQFGVTDDQLSHLTFGRGS
jgi:hypothetical protein